MTPPAASGDVAPPPPARPARWLAVLVLLLPSLVGTSLAQDGWELKVCAQQDNLPFSDRDRSGFENRIARVLADELGAELDLHWLPSSTAHAQRLALRRGACDLVMGVSDGTAGFLTTLAYYRSFPVFVQRQDARYRVASFEDPALADLRIGVLAGGGARVTQVALSRHGLLEGVTSFAWDADRARPLAAPIEAVANGTVDVALVWGPIGGYFAPRQEVPLEVAPVEPKVQLPDLNMIVPIAMGVRPGDEALRDRLDAALVAGWDEVAAVLQEYRVPQEELPRPVLTLAGEAEQGTTAARAGLVLPLPSGETPVERSAPTVAAEAARMGAILAEEELARESESEGAGASPALEVVVTTAPGPAAARRAAQRLVQAEEVVALIGGFGDDQALALQETAEGASIPFLDVGSQDHSLHRTCSPVTLHMEADEAAYLEALAVFFVEDGHRRWFVVSEEGARGEALAALARGRLERQGAEVVGRARLRGELRFAEAMGAIAGADADAVLLLLDWRAQLDFLGFYDAKGLAPVLVGLPRPATQTRDFYDAWRNAAGDADALRRVASWEATLERNGAGELNRAFLARWGLPMDAPAWTAYRAVARLARAVEEVGSEPRAVLRRLERPAERSSDGDAAGASDGGEAARRPRLHLVRIDPDAERPLAFAEHLASMRPQAPARCVPPEGDR